MSLCANRRLRANPRRALLALGMALAAPAISPAEPRKAAEVIAGLDAIYPELDALYRDLHQSPELSWHEGATAAKLAEKLRPLGFEVTTGVGRTGIVGVLRNGKGPTVLLRTELDALPVEEKTGLPYASKVTARNDAGEVVPVMHACGHDIHMTSWVGAATLLARSKQAWRGTLVMIGQPAEEVVEGAAAMLADGLFTRFPKPDFAVMVHDTGQLPAGKVGVVRGYAEAGARSVEVTFHGKGGHAAMPHKTIDPVVIAARAVLAFQTIVSREMNPLDPAVVTVGSIHGGTKGNIIPDDVKLQLSIRSQRDEVEHRVLAAIERIAQGEAAAAGAPPPTIVVAPGGAHATYNDPALTRRLSDALSRALGKTNLVDYPPIMGSEDFSEFGRAGVPATFFWIGAIEPALFERAKAAGESPPSNHTARFAPDPELTIKAATSVMTVCARELLGRP